jgi:hypothetical protein
MVFNVSFAILGSKINPTKCQGLVVLTTNFKFSKNNSSTPSKKNFIFQFFDEMFGHCKKYVLKFSKSHPWFIVNEKSSRYMTTALWYSVADKFLQYEKHEEDKVTIVEWKDIYSVQYCDIGTKCIN